MISILYVSQSLIDAADRAPVLDDIHAVSIARNSALDITGLLIASPQHFAQLLEGPAAGVAAVMSSITADPRHTALRILRQSKIARRSFPLWRMARFDSENFGNAVAPLFAAAHAGVDPDALRRLEGLMQSFVTTPAPALNAIRVASEPARQ